MVPDYYGWDTPTPYQVLFGAFGNPPDLQGGEGRSRGPQGPLGAPGHGLSGVHGRLQRPHQDPRMGHTRLT